RAPGRDRILWPNRRGSPSERHLHVVVIFLFRAILRVGAGAQLRIQRLQQIRGDGAPDQTPQRASTGHAKTTAAPASTTRPTASPGWRRVVSQPAAAVRRRQARTTRTLRIGALRRCFVWVSSLNNNTVPADRGLPLHQQQGFVPQRTVP